MGGAAITHQKVKILSKLGKILLENRKHNFNQFLSYPAAWRFISIATSKGAPERRLVICFKS